MRAALVWFCLLAAPCAAQGIDPDQVIPRGRTEPIHDLDPTDETTMFTHVLARTTEYYLHGPQQMSPPDGRLRAGTRVTLVREAGSYSQVRAGELEAYVETAALRRWSAEEEQQLARLAAGINQFAFDLYGATRQSSEDNVFLSPYSVSVCLAMAYGGARGETAEQMARVLHFDFPYLKLHGTFRALSEILAAGEGQGYQLSIANRLWAQQGYEFRPAYLELTERYYAAPLAEVDFRQHLEEARQRINAWVSQETQDRIKDLIPPGGVNPTTRLVLANAIYFKGEWSEPFDPKQTREAPFVVSPEKSVTASLMYQQDRFFYGQFDDLQVLEMPYGNEDLSLVVLLPAQPTGLAKLESNLSGAALGDWLSKLGRREVQVFLPKFTLTAEYSLAETLAGLGMPLPFSNRADFSGMTSNEALFISAVLHKAFVDVNEKGTEAAAATGVVIAPTAAPLAEEIPVFRADHPFLFVIRDRRTEAILFLGRLIEPK
jgi:serpin B